MTYAECMDEAQKLRHQKTLSRSERAGLDSGHAFNRGGKSNSINKLASHSIIYFNFMLKSSTQAAELYEIFIEKLRPQKISDKVHTNSNSPHCK